jgi:hypothetical protein
MDHAKSPDDSRARGLQEPDLGSTQSIGLSHSIATNEQQLSDPRLVPRAMATTVADYGTPEAQALYEYWRDFLNPKLFDGRLPEPLIRYGALPAKLLGSYQARDAQGVRSTITIRHSLQDDLARAKDTLIHEAIHMGIYELGSGALAPEPGYRGHGPLFAAECNRISEILDLRYSNGERVVWTPKGRNQGEDCAHFPDFDPQRTTHPSAADEETDNTTSLPPDPTTEIGPSIPVGAGLPPLELVKAQANALSFEELSALLTYISAVLTEREHDQQVQ